MIQIVRTLRRLPDGAPSSPSRTYFCPCTVAEVPTTSCVLAIWSSPWTRSSIVDSSKPASRKNRALALPTGWLSERRYLPTFPGSTTARSACGSFIRTASSQGSPAASHDYLRGLNLPQVARKGYCRDKAAPCLGLKSSFRTRAPPRHSALGCQLPPAQQRPGP